jgi:hypothetical protein
MNDRELLEFAAKAAGMSMVKAQESLWFYSEAGTYGEGFYRIEENCYEFWNPLTDDGDALRLAVKLELSIQPDSDLVMVGDMYCEWEYFEDRGEATRIAIVRAAAEIGKAMQ